MLAIKEVKWVWQGQKKWASLEITKIVQEKLKCGNSEETNWEYLGQNQNLETLNVTKKFGKMDGMDSDMLECGNTYRDELQTEEYSA